MTEEHPDYKTPPDKSILGDELPIEGELAQPMAEIEPAQLATPAELATPAPAGTPATQVDRFVELALQSGDMAQLEKMLELKERYDKEEARKAFTAAMAAFKSEEINIEKDKDVQFQDSAGNWIRYSHASLGNVVETAVPYMGRHGLSHRWITEQKDSVITVTCIITHSAGHSESNSLQAGADTSGKKNAIQQVASTITYLERYTFLAITGLATRDMLDDDGEQAGQVGWQRLSDEQVFQIHSLITDNELNEAYFVKWMDKAVPYAHQQIENIAVEHYDKVIKALNKTIENKRNANS